MNIILYPRLYNKRGAENSHSVLGVTHEGELVNIKLRLDKVTENSPSIKEFTREDRKAKQVCKASEDNGHDKREGVLLFTRCFLDEKDYNGKQTNYVAKWATVLCEDKDSNEPILGFGRLVIPKDFETYKSLAEKLQNAFGEEDNDKIEEIKTEMANYSNFSFPGIFYLHDKIRTFISSEMEEARSYVCECIDEVFQAGMVGGFAIRLLTKDYRVIPNSYLEVFQKYNSKTKEYITAKQTASIYFKSDHAKTAFKSNEFLIDIIPLKRLNSGKFTTKHYSSKNVYPMVKSLYSTIKGNIKICKVVAKTYNFVNLQGFDETKVLLDRMHSLSEPLGHPMRLAKDGTMSLLLRGESSDSLNTDTEKLYWIGNDKSRQIMSRNHQILYLLDKGYMPTHTKNTLKDTVQLISNDQNPCESYLIEEFSEQSSKSFNEDIKQNEIINIETISEALKADKSDDDPAVITITDSDSKNIESNNYINDSSNDAHELTSAENIVHTESSLNTSTENTFVEDHSNDIGNDLEGSTNMESSDTPLEDNSDIKADSDINLLASIENNDEISLNEQTIESGTGDLIANTEEKEVIFDSLIDLENTLSSDTGEAQDTQYSDIESVTDIESMVDQDSLAIGQDCELNAHLEDHCDAANANETVEYIKEKELDIEDEDLSLIDCDSKQIDSIEQKGKEGQTVIIADTQDASEILARWTNGTAVKRNEAPDLKINDNKTKPQLSEACENTELTGMAAFMKSYLE